MAIPQDWMQLVTSDYQMYSKDGTYLQYIFIQERSLEKSFRFARKMIEPNMLPHEVAEIVLDDLRSDPQIKNLTVLSNEPATLGGVTGFKLNYTYIDLLGVETESLYYGVLLPKVLFNLRYTAARRYYFAKDLAVFERVRQSLRLIPQ